jgi:hypothetical protein
MAKAVSRSDLDGDRYVVSVQRGARIRSVCENVVGDGDECGRDVEENGFVEEPVEMNVMQASASFF